MDALTIQVLKDAVNLAPENTALRLRLAEILLQAGMTDEAQEQFLAVLSRVRDSQASLGLARTYFQKGQYSACNVVLEALIAEGQESPEVLVLHAQALLQEQSIDKAIEVYQQAMERYPGLRDETLDQALRIPQQGQDTDDLIEDALHFVQKPSLRFSDVGGMEQVKKEIELKILRPLLHPELYKAYGKKTGGGILLYGPPGCGKTFIAKATAGEVNVPFINVALNDILDMWIGNSEKNLHEIFETARQHKPCVLFIDEIDALGASRADMKHSGSRHLINQFLQELDGVDADNEGLLILGATNTPWHLDPAFRRPGRFDRIIFVPPPDAAARAAILELKLKEKPKESIDYAAVAKQLEGYSGADIDALVDIAIEEKLEAAFTDGVPKPLSGKDLLRAAKKHKASTTAWFATAKNFALFANDSGLYDDILTYLNIKK